MREADYQGYVAVEYVWVDWELCNEVDNLSETILMRDFLRCEMAKMEVEMSRPGRRSDSSFQAANLAGGPLFAAGFRWLLTIPSRFARARAPPARRGPDFLMKEPAEIVFILEPALVGYFLRGERGFREQIAGAGQSQFQQILVGTHAGVAGKSVAKRRITHTQLPGEFAEIHR